MHETLDKNEDIRGKLKAVRADVNIKDRQLETTKRLLERMTTEKNELQVRPNRRC